jgi:hypothetical protein
VNPDRSAAYWTLLVLGALATFNGAMMLIAPEPWFLRAAADTGPLNLHFVRDVGAAYAASGLAALWAAHNAEWRAPLAACAALFQILHAAIHVSEATGGGPPIGRLLGETAVVFLPTLMLTGVALHALRRARTRL